MKKSYRNPDGSLKEPTRYISLGGGVQSTALVLMAVDGMFGKVPSAALFADLEWERAGFYEHMEKLEEAVAPFPIVSLKPGNIRALTTQDEVRWASIPLFTRNEAGKPAQLPRQCSYEYKIMPIRKWVKSRLEERSRVPRPNSVEMWLGISTDEAHRMKPSTVNYIYHRYPLVEYGISRDDCSRYLEERGWQVKRSACRGCPYTSNADWREMRQNSPEEWADVVEFDKQIRHKRSVGPLYVHRSALPLEVAVNVGEENLHGFDAECEGMCDV